MLTFTFLLVVGLGLDDAGKKGSTPTRHPVVQPGPNEPDWVVLLDRLYG